MLYAVTPGDAPSDAAHRQYAPGGTMVGTGSVRRRAGLTGTNTGVVVVIFVVLGVIVGSFG